MRLHKRDQILGIALVIQENDKDGRILNVIHYRVVQHLWIVGIFLWWRCLHWLPASGKRPNQYFSHIHLIRSFTLGLRISLWVWGFSCKVHTISVFYACISTQKDMMKKASTVNSIFYFNERHQKTFGDTRTFETCDTVEIIVILQVLSGREDQNSR